jgi:hypothetical protein
MKHDIRMTSVVMKQIIYSVRNHTNIRHLKQPMKEDAASVTHDVLGPVWQEMEYHLDVCTATNGSHMEFKQTCGKTELFFNSCIVYVSYSV